jgi:hypothetical protein
MHMHNHRIGFHAMITSHAFDTALPGTSVTAWSKLASVNVLGFGKIKPTHTLDRGNTIYTTPTRKHAQCIPDATFAGCNAAVVACSQLLRTTSNAQQRFSTPGPSSTHKACHAKQCGNLTLNAYIQCSNAGRPKTACQAIVNVVVLCIAALSCSALFQASLYHGAVVDSICRRVTTLCVNHVRQLLCMHRMMRKSRHTMHCHQRFGQTKYAVKCNGNQMIKHSQQLCIKFEQGQLQSTKTQP